MVPLSASGKMELPDITFLDVFNTFPLPGVATRGQNSESVCDRVISNAAGKAISFRYVQADRRRMTNQHGTGPGSSNIVFANDSREFRFQLDRQTLRRVQKSLA